MKKYDYTERRILGMSKLRSVCIKENWYTSGTSEEYYNLLNMAEKENITTDDLVEMASDIVEHTYELVNNMDDEMFKNVMFIIANACTTVID